MIIQLSLLVLLMIIALGPGMLVARRLRLAPLERLCTAVGISGIIIYLIATAIYLSGINWRWTYLISLLFFIALLLNHREFRRLLSNHAACRALVGFALLFIWTLILLMLIRNYSGGVWSGDWVEHFDRTQFFLYRRDPGYLLIGLYLLPARPPMMNITAAFFLAQVGKGFPAFALCFAVLNLAAFFPAALLLNHLKRRGFRSFWLFLGALLSSPFFAENVTYTWTKLFCAFYVLLGLALYLRRRNILAFIMLAAACLVHYSAGPFTLFITAHYLWSMFRTRWNWREFLIISMLCAALLASWFGWSIQRYGLRGTTATNTSITDASKFSASQNLAKIAKNIVDSFVPQALLNRMDPRWHEQSSLGFLRDVAFFCYQQNVLLMLGSAGAIIGIWVLWRTIKTKPKNTGTPNTRNFWIGLLAFCIPVAIATVGQYEQLGLAHAVLQPVALIGIAAVAAYARSIPRWAFTLLLLGFALDFSLGILLQFYLEHLTFTPIVSPSGVTYWSMPLQLVLIAAENFHLKQIFGLTFLGDYLAAYSTILLTILALAEFTTLYLLWGARWRNHDSGSRRAVERKLS